jgi:site-specific DNA-methyltransferase (adenine-specific)
MKPYYDHSGVTIYHGDCREILADVKADVLVTDPPYGVGFHGKGTKHTKQSGGYLRADDAAIGPEVVRVALTMVVRGLVFPGSRILFDYPRPDDLGGAYCPSGAGRGRWGFTCFNPVLFYGTRPNRPGMLPTTFRSFDLADDVDHPCPKPMAWMRWAVELSSLPEETTLDPFCGSGTTLRAAKDLGRRAIGIEIEERYCEIAAKRCAQEVLDLAGGTP